MTSACRQRQNQAHKACVNSGRTGHQTGRLYCWGEFPKPTGSVAMGTLPRWEITVSRYRSGTALCAVTAAFLGVLASTAAAATSTTTAPICAFGDIGNPGRINAHGLYAGEVEQQYDGCGHVRAHFQYDHNYWLSHSGYNWSAHPCVQTLDYHGQGCNGAATVDGPQDAYSDWIDIHSAKPDWWQAIVTIPNGCSEAGGSWHDYSNGNNWGDYASC